MARATFERGAKLARWERKLENPKAALKQIGALMVAESQQAFRSQSFGRKRWDPRGEVNVFGIIADFAQGRREPPRRRFQRRPALRDTGRLASSIAFRVIANDTVEVGSNLEYAGVLHHGGETESEKLTKDVRRRLWLWLKKQSTSLKRKLGWLLNKKFLNQKLTHEVPARPFVGITRRTREDIKDAIGVKVMEVGRGRR